MKEVSNEGAGLIIWPTDADLNAATQTFVNTLKTF